MSEPTPIIGNETDPEAERRNELKKLTSAEYFSGLADLEAEYEAIYPLLRRISDIKASVSVNERKLRNELILDNSGNGFPKDLEAYVATAKGIAADEKLITPEEYKQANDFYGKRSEFCRQYGLNNRNWDDMHPAHIFDAIETEWLARRMKLSTKSE